MKNQRRSDNWLVRTGVLQVFESGESTLGMFHRMVTYLYMYIGWVEKNNSENYEFIITKYSQIS